MQPNRLFYKLISVSEITPLNHRTNLYLISLSDASSVEKLANIIQRSKEEVNSLKKAIHRMNQAKYSFKDLIGESPIFTKCLNQAKLAADVNSTVLITGESGTGKNYLSMESINSATAVMGPLLKSIVLLSRPISWKASFLSMKRALLLELTN